MRDRERQRLERRRAVARAAREWQRHVWISPFGDVYYHTFPGECYTDYGMLLHRALALPKPWTAGGQRWQPKRTTRAQRRRRRWIEDRQFWAEVGSTWSRELTAAEIKALYEAGEGVTYPFEDPRPENAL